MDTIEKKKRHSEAVMKHSEKSVIQLNFKLNRNTDADIIAALTSVGNKQGFLKELIRDWIANHEN